MRRKSLISILFVLSFHVLFAQEYFRAGYIVMHSNDTIWGEIDYRGDLRMSQVCRFKSDKGDVYDYKPENIVFYQLDSGKSYVSKEINGRINFLEYLVNGKIDVYYMRDQKGDRYFIEKEGERIAELTYEKEFRYFGDKLVEHETKTHRGILNYYMNGAPEMQSEINSLKKPEHRNLINLVKKYHKVVCNDEQCIVYEKTLPLFKAMPELISGFTKFRERDNLRNEFYFQNGLLLNIWMPRTNEKLYFKTGVLITKFDFIEKEKTYFKIPAHLEYIYPHGNFKPRFSYGINFYRPAFRTVSFDAGATIKVAKKLNFCASAELEFKDKVLILPSRYEAFSIHFGLMLEL